MLHTGDRPGAGEYICTRCQTLTTLQTDDSALPLCPHCGNNAFTKNEDEFVQ